MKHFKHPTLAILAFTSLLATPPAMMEHKSIVNRSIASVEEVIQMPVKNRAPAEPSVKPLTADELKLPKVELPDLPAIRVAKAEPEIKVLKAEDLAPLPKVELPELKSEDIKVASEREIKLLDFDDLKPLPKIELPLLEDVKVGYPRYEKLVSKVNKKQITKDIEVSLKQFIAKRDELKAELAKLKEDKSNKKNEKIEALVADLLIVEASLKDLKEKKAIDSKEDEATEKLITDAKETVDALLGESEKVAEAAKEEVSKKEEKEEVKTAKSEEKCDEKVSVLSKQVEQLMADNNKIMQSMLSMTQMMMMNMLQQQQQRQQMPYQFPNQFAYQYQQPQTAGSWVYQPQGFNPYQQNIFAQPQYTQYQQGSGYYPDQMSQQSSWNLQPSMSFNTSTMVTPGTFGGGGLSYNMSNSVPTISQF